MYEREGLPCFQCQAPIRRKVIGQRSSYYCPRCQRESQERTSTTIGLALDLIVLFFQRVQVLLLDLLRFPQGLELRADEGFLNGGVGCSGQNLKTSSTMMIKTMRPRIVSYSSSSSWRSFSESG